jgi:hypothetical protein
MQDHETKFSDILQNLKVLTLSDDEKMQVIQVLGFDHQYQDNGRVVIYTSIYDSANDLQPTAINKTPNVKQNVPCKQCGRNVFESDDSCWWCCCLNPGRH